MSKIPYFSLGNLAARAQNPMFPYDFLTVFDDYGHPKRKSVMKPSPRGPQKLIFSEGWSSRRGESKSEVKTRGLLSKVYVYDGFMFVLHWFLLNHDDFLMYLR